MWIEVRMKFTCVMASPASCVYTLDKFPFLSRGSGALAFGSGASREGGVGQPATQGRTCCVEILVSVVAGFSFSSSLSAIATTSTEDVNTAERTEISHRPFRCGSVVDIPRCREQLWGDAPRNPQSPRTAPVSVRVSE